MRFLRDVRIHANRRYGKNRLRIDFVPLEEITPAAALLLVAEFDRWRARLPGNKLQPVALNRWNPSVRRRLREMGFFEVLGTVCHVPDPVIEAEDRYLPFTTGKGSDGQAIKNLRLAIESLGLEIKDKSALYDGVVEAMTNVQQHAYRTNSPIKRWWVSASVNVSSNRLHVMVVDHGDGITATMRKKGYGEHFRSVVGGPSMPFFHELLEDDARLLEAAFDDTEDSGRSQTGEAYRGKGLRQDIKGYVATHNSSGRLRVVTNHARFTYVRHADGVEDSVGEFLKIPFEGTFIEWTIEEYGDVSPDVSN